MAVTRCEKFARLIARKHGISYEKAIQMFPRGAESKSVYVDDVHCLHAHCVHCARAEALSKMTER